MSFPQYRSHQKHRQDLLKGQIKSSLQITALLHFVGPPVLESTVVLMFISMIAMTSDHERPPIKVSPAPTNSGSSFRKVSSVNPEKRNLTSQLNTTLSSLHLNILSTKDRDRDENKNKDREKERTTPPATAIGKKSVIKMPSFPVRMKYYILHCNAPTCQQG